MQKISEDIENKQILREYRQLIRLAKPKFKEGDEKRVRRAFEIAVEAHRHMRRKSGEPYIFHPLAVAKIMAGEIGMGSTSVICALLHDTVEDTEITLKDVEKEFGTQIAKIIDGLTKIDKIATTSESIQAENYRKIIFTLGDDIRVILVKLADRLHNMRTLNSMSRTKQLQMASETLYLYAPLAHRLGLYVVKSELEDLAMKYTEPEKFKEIANKLSVKKKEREAYIDVFVKTLSELLIHEGINAKVFGRPKTIFSIWRKMKLKEVDFEEVYDKFAIRVIVEEVNDSDKEKANCWRAYSIIASNYSTISSRFRDWITNPKSNGYQSLHTTVIGPEGRQVEVQIRTERMDEISEKGLAAHWKYKEGRTGTNKIDDAFESWLVQVRDLLKNAETNPLEFINNFKLQLYSKEIYVFTPKGDIKNLPKGSTALDFAFTIHTDVGSHCMGAKINGKLVPISHQLNNGDQVEIITSSKQKPNEDWLSFVATSRAKEKIKTTLKEEKKKVAEQGRETLIRKLKQLKIQFEDKNILFLTNLFKMPTTLDLYFNIAHDKIDLSKLKSIPNIAGFFEAPKNEIKPAFPKIAEFSEEVPQLSKDTELHILGESSDKYAYEFAKCCTPVPGDDVVGFISVNGVVKIHRANCSNAINLMSRFGYRVIKTQWSSKKSLASLTTLNIGGMDDIGLLNKITSILSDEFKINIQSISVDSNDGVFNGTIKIFVKDNKQLNGIIKHLRKIKSILTVERS